MGNPVTRTPNEHTPSPDDDDGFAGTRPASSAASAALHADPRARASSEQRTCYRFQMSRDCLSVDYGGVVSDAQLSFAMVELTPTAEQKAMARAGGGMQVGAMLQEMQLESIYKIGDTPTRGNRRLLEAWWKGLGPKGRKLVERAFNKIHMIGDDEEETFLDTQEVSVE